MEKKLVKVMVFGTFDGLHEGHLSLFKQAKKLAKNPFLVVSIARDENVFRIKGQLPLLNENKRKRLLTRCQEVDKVVLSGLSEHLPHIVKEKPDIIALGYDQKDYIKNLKNDLQKNGLSVKIVRLKPYKEKIYKNSLLKKSTNFK